MNVNRIAELGLEDLRDINPEILLVHGIQPKEWQVVLDREKKNVISLLRNLVEAKSLNGDPEKIATQDIRVRLINWISATYHHKDQIRNSDKSFYSSHLWAVAQIAIENGFTEQELIDAMIAHDTIEDNEFVRTGQNPIFFDLYEHIIENASSKEIAEQNNRTRLAIAGVTKPKNPNKDDRNRQYLEILVRHLLVDARSIVIKLCDRLHNMRTISGQPEHKQKNIAQETLQVFVPLAKRLGLYGIQEELVRLSLKVLNLKLIEDFDFYVSEQTEKLRNSQVLRELDGQFNPEITNPTGLSQRTRKTIQELKKRVANAGVKISVFDPNNVKSVAIEPHLLVSRLDLADLTKGIENLTIEDLDLPEREIFANITVIVKDPADEETVMNEIRQKFANQAKLENPAYGANRGNVLKVIIDGLGKIFIRVNSEKKEHISKRGKLDKFNQFEVPKEIQKEVSKTLDRVESHGVDIRQALTPELFGRQLRVTVSNNLKNQILEVSSNATIKDLYKIAFGHDMPDHIKTRIIPSAWADRDQHTSLEVSKEDKVRHANTYLFVE